MPGWYELRSNDIGHWNFVLKAGNGEIILRSEQYTSKAAAERGISSVVVNCAFDERYERKNSSSGHHYFNLKAANHQVIGTSALYVTASAREAGIASVKASGRKDLIQTREYTPPTQPPAERRRVSPAPSAIRAFVSHTREKDAYDNIVSEFRNRLCNELRLRDREAEVFLDKAAISAGSRFPVAIEDALDSADVLIVLLSPAWLQSAWCRKELERFVELKSAKGRFPQVLPLLWVSVDLSKHPNDPLATFLGPIQYRDWRDLRKKKWQSTALRNELDTLADVIVKLAEKT